MNLLSGWLYTIPCSFLDVGNFCRASLTRDKACLHWQFVFFTSFELTRHLGFGAPKWRYLFRVTCSKFGFSCSKKCSKTYFGCCTPDKEISDANHIRFDKNRASNRRCWKRQKLQLHRTLQSSLKHSWCRLCESHTCENCPTECSVLQNATKQMQNAHAMQEMQSLALHWARSAHKLSRTVSLCNWCSHCPHMWTLVLS